MDSSRHSIGKALKQALTVMILLLTRNANRHIAAVV